MMFVFMLLVVYLAICIGTYARVMSAQKIKYAFLPSLIAPLFSIYFLDYEIVRAKKESDIIMIKQVIFHLYDVMFLFVVLVACIRYKNNQDKNERTKWSDFTEDIYSGLNAY